MLGDPHSRSAHRASPAGGLGVLTPQALVRHAQAGQARARQAIIRQALARSRRADRPAAVPGAPSRLGVGERTSGRLAAIWQAAAFQATAPERVGPHRLQPRSRQRAGAVGQPRRASARRAPRAQHVLQTLMRGLGALIVFAVVGLSAFFVIAEESRGQERASAAAPGSVPGIASRQADPEPLTQHEVFPEPTVQLAAGATGYLISMTHSDSECRIATRGELGALLEDYGCAQVVRARLTAPYGGYQVTAGVFNLPDEGGAAKVSELTGALVESGRGTFTTLGGSAGDPLTEPLAQVGWRSHGHYLLYSVVSRPDGQLVTDDDPYAARISAELVEDYLGRQVIGRRTLDP